ncbi:MAG TPA: YggS family pyridoxal phosphate-dependent enzyme [Crocinitomicaceae bacterium]|nr:YggS family pyridoxal phosphate-dependent enzyme [Crocinitomicaceae bacterium]
MIAENLQVVQQTIPANVKLVAVGKMNSIERILEVYHAGHKVFGENRVQELLPKYEALPKDIEWHLIGHLQTNKVKYIAPFVSLIQSVDSHKLLREINKEAQKNSRTIDVLLQFHVAQEETKFGFSLPEAREMLKNGISDYKNIRIVGIMGMASNVDNEQQIRKEFKILKSIFEELKQNYFPNDTNFKELSMGMSSDYQLAIEEGATIVRVGSKIFK